MCEDRQNSQKKVSGAGRLRKVVILIALLLLLLIGNAVSIAGGDSDGVTDAASVRRD